MQMLIETAGRLVASKGTRGSGVTAPYGTIDDAGRVQLSVELEDLVGNHGDGLWRRDHSPNIPNDRTDGSREDSQCYDHGGDE